MKANAHHSSLMTRELFAQLPRRAMRDIGLLPSPGDRSTIGRRAALAAEIRQNEIKGEVCVEFFGTDCDGKNWTEQYTYPAIVQRVEHLIAGVIRFADGPTFYVICEPWQGWSRKCRNCGERFEAATRGQNCCSSECRGQLRTFSAPSYTPPLDPWAGEENEDVRDFEL